MPVRLWTLRLAELPDDAFERLTALLSKDEIERAGRFRFDDDRRAFVAAHALVRTLLAQVTGLAPRDLRFAGEEQTKPKLDPSLGIRDLDFSLSHTRGFVAAAAGTGVDVGVDVETLDREHDGDAIAAAYFAPSEISAIAGSSPSERRACFLSFWTAKEAILKAAGTGLSLPLNAVTIGLDPPAVLTCDPQLGAPGRWTIVFERPGPRHVVAVATRAHGNCSSARTSVIERRHTAIFGDGQALAGLTIPAASR